MANSTRLASPAAPNPTKSDPVLLAEFEVWHKGLRASSPHTITAYLSDLRSLSKTLAGKSLAEASWEDLSAHATRLQKEGLSSATRQRAHVSIKQFYRFLIEQGEVADDPSEFLEKPRASSPLPKILSEREVRSFLEAAAEGRGALALRDKAICETLYGTGVRQEELATMTLTALNLENEEVLISGKGGSPRILPLLGTFLQAIEEYVAESRPYLLGSSSQDHNFLWVSRTGMPIDRKTVVRVVAKVGAKAGLKVTPHMLRHSIAVHLLEKGVGLLDLKELLGHKTLKTTTIYARMSMRLVEQAYRQSHPRS